MFLPVSLRAASALTLVAFLLPSLLPAATQPAIVTLGDLAHTYDGAPKVPSVATSPLSLPTQIVYHNLSPNAPTPSNEIVYNDTPEPLANSYLSYGFHAQNLTALGNYIKLGKTARKIHSCDVILVNWAKAADWPELAAENPDGYIHPISITIYELKSTNELVFRTDVTQDILVPWRPTTNPDGSPYTLNGYAFRATLAFPNGIILPEHIMAMVSFNTQASGFSPTLRDGPYNSLNVALKNSLNVVPVGSDLNNDVVLQIRNGTWFYPSTGWKNVSAPMLRIVASSEETITPPVDAGTWRATARVANADFKGSAAEIITIQPAVATVTIEGLTQVVDGTEKPVTVTTVPPGLSVTTTYNHSLVAPVSLGRYAVFADLDDPNYQGQATAELWLGNDFQSWLHPWLHNGDISASATGGHEDPDGDSITNLMEYALALDPSTASHGLDDLGLPRVDIGTTELSLIYRRNISATDLQYEIEVTDDLGNPESWSVVESQDEILSTENHVQTVRATVGNPRTGATGFIRLKVSRSNDN